MHHHIQEKHVIRRWWVCFSGVIECYEVLEHSPHCNVPQLLHHCHYVFRPFFHLSNCTVIVPNRWSIVQYHSFKTYCICIKHAQTKRKLLWNAFLYLGRIPTSAILFTTRESIRDVSSDWIMLRLVVSIYGVGIKFVQLWIRVLSL